MSFDYAIVRGGSAGSPLASRLGEDPDTRACLQAGLGAKTVASGARACGGYA